MEHNHDNGLRMEDLLETKSFNQLTATEKTFVLNEIGSEHEYEALRKIGRALVADKADLSPDPIILAKLQRSMRRPEISTPWYLSAMNFRIPAYAVALLLAGVALAFSLFREDNEIGGMAERQAIIVDTLYVKIPSDTVYLERTVVKYVKDPQSPVSNYSVVNHSTKKETVPPEGVNMKEKEELEKFLVSGS